MPPTMPPTNRERVDKALDLLKDGLGPFVERKFANVYGASAQSEAANLRVAQRDVAKLLKLMKDDTILRNGLSKESLSLVFELIEHRNKWAHQGSFSIDDAYRVLDSTVRLLTAVKAPQAAEAENMKLELGQLIYAQPVRSEKYKTGGKEIPCPLPGCQKVFRDSRGGWDAHIASPKKHPEWHPEIDDPEGRKARFKAEFADWFTRG